MSEAAPRAIEILQVRLRKLSPDVQERELLARIGADLAVLGAEAMSGRDVSRELGHVRAQAANLSAAVAEQLTSEWRKWANEILTSILIGAL